MAPSDVCDVCPIEWMEFEMLKRNRVLALGFVLIPAALPPQAVSQQGGSTGDNGFEITSDVVYGHKAGMALTFDVLTRRMPTAGPCCSW